MLQNESAPAYDGRPTSSPEPISPLRDRAMSPSGIAATLQSRGAAVEDASADIFRGKNGRRPSVDYTGLAAASRAQENARMAYLGNAGAAAGTSAAAMASTTASGSEAIEMQQRQV